MENQSISLITCICTYKRIRLLEFLINDLLKQSILPELICIVDGDPKSFEVIQLLKNIQLENQIKLIYIPSNHANLSYQRFLGWKKSSSFKTNFFLYLDDDLRIYDPLAIEKLMEVFKCDEKIVGVTSQILMGNFKSLDSDYGKIYYDKKIKKPKLIQLLGASKSLRPGSLSPTGNRIPACYSEEKPTPEVEWLHGGVMLYKMKALDQPCFSDDLFALDHIKCGKGEDTFLSRRVLVKGKLILHSQVFVDHPNEDLPTTYPVDAYHFAFALAYSRRFLNDHFRITSPPLFIDRFALFKSYLGNNIINFFRVFIHPAKFRFAFALGYFVGSLQGLFCKPTAKSLTPQIDWWQDAEEALQISIEIQ